MMRSSRVTPAPQHMAEALVALGTIAIDTARRLERAELLSLTDDLTGLPNRRHLRQALDEALATRTGEEHPVSLLIVDLDGFKTVNDRYGHPLGDRVLVEAGMRLRASTRRTDLAARVGGDEFAVLLPATGSRGAAAVASRLQRCIARRPFGGCEGVAIRLSASIGSATARSGLPSGVLIQAADDALYRVKRPRVDSHRGRGARARSVRRAREYRS